MRLPHSSRRVDLAGPAGRLEALLELPKDGPVGAGVVCHPHPLHGGTLHNKIVYQVAKGLVEAGVASLRFNFRGTGLSSGVHDEGRGEAEDVAAALDLLADRFPAAPQVVAGFSFGALVGLRVARSRPDVRALVGVGVPLSHGSFEFLLGETRPLLLLHGSEDPFGLLEDVQRLAAEIGPTARLHVVEGTGHFFEGHVPAVREVVREFCAAHIGE